MKIFITILILGYTFKSGYSFVGVKLDDRAIVLDNKMHCVVFDGQEKKCSLKDLSIILKYWR